MSKLLIAYFSHEGEAYVRGTIMPLPAGNTHVAAEMIHELTDADLFRIEPVVPYPYNYRETVGEAKKEFQNNERPAIAGPLPDLSAYDTILLGYPNWCGTFPMIVRSFLEQSDLDQKTILPFCTNEGSGIAKSEADLKTVCAGSTVRSGLSIIGADVKDARPAIEKWLDENNIAHR